MKKPILIIVAAVLAMGINAQTTVRDAWLNMPDTITPYLTKQMRTELMDLANMKIESKVKNLLHGESRIDTITTDFMQVSLSSSTVMQLRLLHKTDSSTVICLLKTYRSPEQESDIIFYTSDWKRDQSRYGLPVFSDDKQFVMSFISKNDSCTISDIESSLATLNPIMINANMSVSSPEIFLGLSTSYMTSDEKEKNKAKHLQRKFKWNGEMFKEI